MKKNLILFGLLFIVFYQQYLNAKDKPIIIVGKDGFPSGNKTPEGAACDLARAFIKKDKELFSSVCIKPYTSNNGPSEYVAFLKNKLEEIKMESEKKEPSTSGPKSIGKVYAGRHLSKKGPASYGYASFGFKDIVFVDVGVFQHDGTKGICRTLVIQDKTDKWFVLPMPDASPLLSEGLADEKKSDLDFSDKYIILQNADVIVPKGVNYEKASDEINLKCQEYILDLLDKKKNERETAASVAGFIGPGLWKKISPFFKTDSVKLFDTNMQMPILGTDKVITTKGATWKDFQMFSKIFELTTDLEVEKANITIRKLTQEELKAHWAVISWDLKEPLFIVEIDKFKYIIDLEVKENKFTIFFIDDISELK